MKVTAFIRKTAAKNNITDQARVYFRVRDIGGVDIKAASELSINPNHWSPERQGYKPRVALVSEEKKMAFDKDVQQITHLITKEYHRGVDGNWLKGLIEEYHHPNINARGGNNILLRTDSGREDRRRATSHGRNHRLFRDRRRPDRIGQSGRIPARRYLYI